MAITVAVHLKWTYIWLFLEIYILRNKVAKINASRSLSSLVEMETISFIIDISVTNFNRSSKKTRFLYIVK